MPRNNTTGVFTRTANSFSNPVAGTVIDASDADALFDDYDLGLTNTGFIDTTLHNCIFGEAAGDAITSGVQSVIIGYQAGTALTSGGPSVIIGSQAGKAVTTSVGDVFVGVSAGEKATIGGGTSQYRVFIGDNAGDEVTSGHAGVYLGRAAGHGIIADLRSVYIGHATTFYGDTVQDNVAIGNAAGGDLINGTGTNYGLTGDSNMTLVGAQTGKSSATARDNCFAIGYLATVPIRDDVGVLGKALVATVTAGQAWSYRNRETITDNAGGVTITTAQMLSGFTQRSGTAGGAPFNDTTPTAAQIVAAGPGVGCEVPVAIPWWYRNSTGQTGTLVAGAGVAVSGGATTATGTGSPWYIVITNSTSGAEAVTIFRLNA